MHAVAQPHGGGTVGGPPPKAVRFLRKPKLALRKNEAGLIMPLAKSRIRSATVAAPEPVPPQAPQISAAERERQEYWEHFSELSVEQRKSLVRKSTAQFHTPRVSSNNLDDTLCLSPNRTVGTLGPEAQRSVQDFAHQLWQGITPDSVRATLWKQASQDQQDYFGFRESRSMSMKANSRKNSRIGPALHTTPIPATPGASVSTPSVPLTNPPKHRASSSTDFSSGPNNGSQGHTPSPNGTTQPSKPEVSSSIIKTVVTPAPKEKGAKARFALDDDDMEDLDKMGGDEDEAGDTEKNCAGSAAEASDEEDDLSGFGDSDTEEPSRAVPTKPKNVGNVSISLSELDGLDDSDGDEDSNEAAGQSKDNIKSDGNGEEIIAVLEVPTEAAEEGMEEEDDEEEEEEEEEEVLIPPLQDFQKTEIFEAVKNELEHAATVGRLEDAAFSLIGKVRRVMVKTAEQHVSTRVYVPGKACLLAAISAVMDSEADTMLVGDHIRFISSLFTKENHRRLRNEVLVLMDLLQTEFPDLCQHLDAVHFDVMDLADCICNWVDTLFALDLPAIALPRIIDLFLFEGPKSLVDITYGLISVHKDLLMRQDKSHILPTFLSLPSICTPEQLEEVFTISYEIFHSAEYAFRLKNLRSTLFWEEAVRRPGPIRFCKDAQTGPHSWLEGDEPRSHLRIGNLPANISFEQLTAFLQQNTIWSCQDLKIKEDLEDSVLPANALGLPPSRAVVKYATFNISDDELDLALALDGALLGDHKIVVRISKHSQPLLNRVRDGACASPEIMPADRLRSPPLSRAVSASSIPPSSSPPQSGAASAVSSPAPASMSELDRIRVQLGTTLLSDTIATLIYTEKSSGTKSPTTGSNATASSQHIISLLQELHRLLVPASSQSGFFATPHSSTSSLPPIAPGSISVSLSSMSFSGRPVPAPLPISPGGVAAAHTSLSSVHTPITRITRPSLGAAAGSPPVPLPKSPSLVIASPTGSPTHAQSTAPITVNAFTALTSPLSNASSAALPPPPAPPLTRPPPPPLVSTESYSSLISNPSPPPLPSPASHPTLLTPSSTAGAPSHPEPELPLVTVSVTPPPKMMASLSPSPSPPPSRPSIQVPASGTKSPQTLQSPDSSTSSLSSRRRSLSVNNPNAPTVMPRKPLNRISSDNPPILASASPQHPDPRRARSSFGGVLPPATSAALSAVLRTSKSGNFMPVRGSTPIHPTSPSPSTNTAASSLLSPGPSPSSVDHPVPNTFRSQSEGITSRPMSPPHKEHHQSPFNSGHPSPNVGPMSASSSASNMSALNRVAFSPSAGPVPSVLHNAFSPSISGKSQDQFHSASTRHSSINQQHPLASFTNHPNLSLVHLPDMPPPLPPYLFSAVDPNATKELSSSSDTSSYASSSPSSSPSGPSQTKRAHNHSHHGGRKSKKKGKRSSKRK